MDITSYLVGASPYDNGFTLNYGDGDYSLESYPLLIPSSPNDFQHTLKEGETLQNRPLSFDFRGETTWATIKSMGRNTPMYHYTGSEDIVQFNVSWYCDDPDNPAEVLTKCRLLESWSKSNAYQAAPPILQIQWGNSDTFEGHYYILTSATYSLSNFRNASRQRMRGSVDIREDLNLYPATATQELIFKRVSSYSLSYEDIVKSKAAEKTVGIFTTDKIK